MERSTLKGKTKDALKGNWTWAVLLTLLTGVVAGVVSCFTRGIVYFISAMLIVGLSYAMLDLLEGHKESNYFTAMFSAFTRGRVIPVFLTWLLSTVFTILWSLLLIVPGIIKALAYSQAFFIVKDMVETGQDVAPTEAITKSRQLMDGHKGEFFLLELSFLGWALLACLTLGIGFLWLKPYVETTNAAYYRALAGDKFRATKGQSEIEAEQSQGSEAPEG